MIAELQPELDLDSTAISGCERRLVHPLSACYNRLTMKPKIIQITLPDAQYDLLGGTPIEELMEAKSIDDIPDGKLDLIAALGETEFDRVRELMLEGAVIEFVRESEAGS